MIDSRIIGLEAGTAGRQELETAIEAAWREILGNADDSRLAAAVLRIAPAELVQLRKAPFEIKSAGAGIGALEVAYIVLIWTGSEVVLGALRDLAKDELKKRLRELWDQVLSKKLRKSLDQEQVGADVDLDRSG